MHQLQAVPVTALFTCLDKKGRAAFPLPLREPFFMKALAVCTLGCLTGYLSLVWTQYLSSQGFKPVPQPECQGEYSLKLVLKGFWGKFFPLEAAKQSFELSLFPP